MCVIDLHIALKQQTTTLQTNLKPLSGNGPHADEVIGVTGEEGLTVG